MFPSQFTASFWGDEAFSAVLSQKPLWQMIKIVSRDTSPPLYYICEHFWFKLFGYSEISIRSLSFLFFLGTVLTVGLIAREIGKKKTIFWATLLTFLNPFLFKYAFEGRMYSILAFTTTLSFYFFMKKQKVAYVLAAVAALYSHHFAIFAIFVQGVWSLILPCHPGAPTFFKKARGDRILSERDSIAAPRILRGLFQNDKVRSLWVYPAILLLYAPWLPSLYYQTTLVGSGFWLATPKIKDLFIVLRSFTVGPENYTLRNFAYFLVGILLLVRRWNFKHPLSRKSVSVSSWIKNIIFRFGGSPLQKSSRKTSKNITKWSSERLDWILLSWFLGPIFLTFAVSQFFQSIFFDRYMLFVIPGAVLLLATRRRNIISPIFLLILVIILARYNWFYFTHPVKKPFQEFTSYMKSELQKGGKIINWNSSAHHLWESKYYGIGGPIYSPSGPLPFYVGTAQMTENDVIYKLPDVERLGVITSGPVEEVVLPNYKLVEFKQFRELKGLWFQKTE